MTQQLIKNISFDTNDDGSINTRVLVELVRTDSAEYFAKILETAKRKKSQ